MYAGGADVKIDAVMFTENFLHFCSSMLITRID